VLPGLSSSEEAIDEFAMQIYKKYQKDDFHHVSLVELFVSSCVMKRVVLFVMLTQILACKDKGQYATVQEKSISESIYASGVVKSVGQYSVFAPVNGIIEELFVEEGDTVLKDQVLMRIGNETSKFSKENALLQAEYANAKNNQDKLREAKLQIDLARNKLSNDSLMYLRQKNLWSKEIGTKVELEQRQLAYESSMTNYNAALIRYQELKRQINLAAKQSANNLKISDQLESDFLIRSTMQGRVYSFPKAVGEMVNPQTPLGIIGDDQQFMLEMEVDEKDIFRIKLGQPVVIRLDSYAEEVFEARISKISPVMNERSKSFMVEANFVKAPNILYPNITFEANIVVNTKENALIIPRVAVKPDSTVTLESGEVKKIKLGLSDFQNVEILEGLKADDQVLLPKIP
jgi:HlyD family secretion protein